MTDDSASASASKATLDPPSREEVAFEKFCLLIEDRFSQMDSKIEALTLSTLSKLDSPPVLTRARGGGTALRPFDSPPEINSRRFEHRPTHQSEHRPNRQSLGSLRSEDSQNVVVTNVKSSFRLDKPKFENPTDPKTDGAFDESVLKYIEDCERHVEIWLNLPENEGKQFEGSEVFALVSLPASVQKRVAHNLERIYEKSELVGWSLKQIQEAKYWNNTSTKEVKLAILERRAQGAAKKDVVKSIQPPAITWPHGLPFIHLDAFEEYKSKLTTQISRLSDGGVSLSFIAIKDAIISAIPDRDFRIELYTQFGHSGSLPGPDASGASQEFSMKSIFDFIRDHIVVIKKKGLAQTVNKNSVSFSGVAFDSSSTPPTSRKFPIGPQRRFPARAVHAIEFQPEFPESDRAFWSGGDAEKEISTEIATDDSDEFHQVNTIIQKAKSKECHHQGIGPDGKVLCPYLGNPDSAKCGFIHPAKELELKGRGVSKSTPVKPKTIHNIVSGLGIDYAHESDFQDDGVDNHDL